MVKAMMDHTQLTDKQAVILHYIKSCINNGMPPTVREIANEFNIRSPNGIVCHLRALEKKGFVKLARRGLARGILLTDQSTDKHATAWGNVTIGAGI